ncbi:MAG: hypothetical protein MdMp014T_0626 [Treponematales bacterium]
MRKKVTTNGANSANLLFKLFFSVRAVCVVFGLILSSCAPKAALENAPIITSATYQHTLYNGRGQPIEATAAKDNAPPFVITYFTSEADFDNNSGGTTEPPAEVGDYYARIERPAGNGYKRGGDIKVEYHIQKAMIAIHARDVQRFRFDGEPKAAAASAEPPVDLRFEYFAGETPLPGPPFQRGGYRVRVSFDGSSRYMGASKDITLIIE